MPGFIANRGKNIVLGHVARCVVMSPKMKCSDSGVGDGCSTVQRDAGAWRLEDRAAPCGTHVQLSRAELTTGRGSISTKICYAREVSKALDIAAPVSSDTVADYTDKVGIRDFVAWRGEWHSI